MAVTESGPGATPGTQCGRTTEDVWSRIDQAPDEHERSCAQCQATRSRLAQLRLVTEDLRSEQPEAPSPSLKSTVMSVARAELRRGRRLEVRTTDDGPIQLTEQVVGAAVREAADRIPGVHARRCAVALDDPTGRTSEQHAVVPEAGVRQIDVSLGVALSVTRPIPRLLDELRTGIRDALATRLGVAVSRVDITVEDLYDVEPERGTGLRVRRVLPSAS